MKILSTSLVLFLASGIVLFGCNRQDDGERVDAVLIVNGLGYTKQMQFADCELRALFVDLALDAGMVDASKKDVIRAQAAKEYADNLIVERIRRLVVLTARNKPLAFEDVGDEFKCYYTTNIACGKLTFEQIEAKVESRGLSETFRRNILEEYAVRAYWQELAKELSDISDQETEELLQRQTRFNAEARKMNERIYANASNVVRRVRMGEKLAKVAAEILKKDEDGDIRDFCDVEEGDGFSDAEIALWPQLKAIPVGGVSEVFEMPDGLYVYQRMDDSGEKSDEGKPLKSFKVLELRRAVLLKELTHSEIKARMREKRKNEKCEGKFKELIRRARISFPQGEAQLPQSVQAFLEFARKDSDQ